MVALSAAHGFAQVTGRPQAVIVHVDVGTQGTTLQTYPNVFKYVFMSTRTRCCRTQRFLRPHPGSNIRRPISLYTRRGNAWQSYRIHSLHTRRPGPACNCCPVLPIHRGNQDRKKHQADDQPGALICHVRSQGSSVPYCSPRSVGGRN